MSEILDPSLSGLTDCGCCAGITAETPAVIYNCEGLDQIQYRVGTHRSFLRTMLAALSESDRPSLKALTTRADDDFSIALLDAWATTADVLTFYQERLANESYLRTCTEQGSVLRLARLIGYQLKPGVAASTLLAFTLETALGSAGTRKARTSWTHAAVVGIPVCCQTFVPFVVHPLSFPSAVFANYKTCQQSIPYANPRPMHPFHLALDWHKKLARLSKAEIAAQEGISRARVTQILNLLKLPEDIQKDLRQREEIT